MKKERAAQIARQEYQRLVFDNMGIFLIAQAWDIQPMRVVQDGYGVLTEAYVLEQMTQQILGMNIEEEERADAKHCDNEDEMLCLRQGALG